MRSALVDTSFLITLARPDDRPRHGVAQQYFRACIDRKVLLYLSTIVIAEFSVRQPIDDLGLRNFVVLPFVIEHAIKAGRPLGLLQRVAGDDRATVKDDIKLIAQCSIGGIDAVLTEDHRTLDRYVERLRADRHVTTRCVVLADGFDDAWFNAGRRTLPNVDDFGSATADRH